MTNDPSARANRASRKMPLVLGGVMVVMLLGVSSTASEGPPVDEIPSGTAWECRRVGPRRLQSAVDAARIVVRAAAALPNCRTSRRLELCESVRTEPISRSAFAASRSFDPTASSICAVLLCDEPREPPAPVAVEDAFGRRTLAARGIDRVCVNIDHREGVE